MAPLAKSAPDPCSRLSCHGANWIKHAESKFMVMRLLCPHTLWLSRCWDVF